MTFSESLILKRILQCCTLNWLSYGCFTLEAHDLNSVLLTTTSSTAHVGANMSVLNVSLATNRPRAHIGRADIWLMSSQIGVLSCSHWGKSWSRGLSNHRSGSLPNKTLWLSIDYTLDWCEDFIQMKTVSECSPLRSPAISPICHSFIMISCPNELLILLKRNACSLQFIISIHFVEQMSTNKPSHTLVIVFQSGFWPGNDAIYRYFT